jgi:hypothetical protein
MVRQPQTDETKRILAEAKREDDFWHDHWPEFLAKYSEEFVAAREGRVIAHDADLRELIRHLSDDDLNGIWLRLVSATRGTHIL